MTGGAAEAFRWLIADGVGPAFKGHGWRRSGQNCWLPNLENWVLVNWQKSRYSTADLITFTGNLHIASKDWYDSQNVPSGRVPATPTASRLGLGIRFGHLLPAQRDTWWEVGNADDAPQLAAELVSVLETAVFPAVEAQLAELNAAPRQCWHNVGGRNWYQKCGRPAVLQRVVGTRRFWRCEDHLPLVGESA
ncbi:MAG: DUF4304 domain-containing protein [Candidatus Nanopelagicales bacterium]